MLLVHGDLKLENILICSEDYCAKENSDKKSHNLKLKIGQVFAAQNMQLTLQKYDNIRIIEDPESSSDFSHFSPELLLTLFEGNGVIKSAKADMWSIGVLFFTFLAGYAPFAETTAIHVLLRIFKTFGTPAQQIINQSGNANENLYPSLF